MVVTDNKNAYAAVQEENKRFQATQTILKTKVDQLKEDKGTADRSLVELKSQLEDAEKKNTILSIKLETAIEEHSTLNEENSTLNKKLEDIINNIGNAESRSEQVRFYAHRIRIFVLKASHLKSGEKRFVRRVFRQKSISSKILTNYSR